MQVVWSWTSLELNQSQEVPVRNMKGRIDGRHVDVAVSFVDAELASAPGQAHLPMRPAGGSLPSWQVSP